MKDLFKKHIWQAATVCLALVIIVFLSIDGCGNTKVDTKASEIRIKELERQKDSISKVNRRISNDLLILQENEVLIRGEITSIATENAGLKRKYIGAKDDWQSLTKNTGSKSDTLCLIALNNCDILVTGMERELSAKDSLVSNVSLQRDTLTTYAKNLLISEGLSKKQSLIKDTTINQLKSEIKRLKPAIKLYLGAFGNYSPKTLNPDVGVNASVIIKDWVQVGYGFGIIQQSHNVNLGFKISVRNKNVLKVLK